MSKVIKSVSVFFILDFLTECSGHIEFSRSNELELSTSVVCDLAA